MAGIQNERSAWLARNILPYEGAIRARIAAWRMPKFIDVDDIIQETYSKMASLDEVTHILNPKAYFTSAARNVFLIRVRREKVVSITSLFEVNYAEFSSEDPQPDQEAADRQQLYQLGRAIQALPEPARSVLELRVSGDLGYRQIGDRVGLSENAVQKLMTKSLKALAQQIGRNSGPETGADRPLHRLRVVDGNG